MQRSVAWQPDNPLQLCLHPTVQSRPYLCNMAVAEAHRRRGYGLALLTAAEALVRSLGENEIYLHTRWVPGACSVGTTLDLAGWMQAEGVAAVVLLFGTTCTSSHARHQPAVHAASPCPAGSRTSQHSCCMPRLATRRWQPTCSLCGCWAWISGGSCANASSVERLQSVAATAVHMSVVCVRLCSAFSSTYRPHCNFRFGVTESVCAPKAKGSRWVVQQGRWSSRI